MEKDPSQPQEPNQPHEPEPISDLIAPTLDEIDRLERNADARDDELRAAFQRQEELRRAAAKDPSFDAEYSAATDAVKRLITHRQPDLNTADPEQASDSE